MIAAAALVLVATAVFGTEWEEIGWGADVVLDAKSGLPAVVFHAALEYTSAVGRYEVETLWEVFAVVDGVEAPLDGISTTSIRTGDVRGIYAASPRVPIEAGGRYRARLILRDPANDLCYERAFDFVAPAAVPFGIRLSGWDGAEPVELSELPDEELEELVLLHDLLEGYASSIDDTSIEEFLRGPAATSAYPVSLLLLPTADIGTSGAPIRIFVVLNLYVYTLLVPDEAAGVLDQLGQFRQDFVGDVFTGAGSPILGGGKTVFVHDAVWPVLEASVAEHAER